VKLYIILIVAVRFFETQCKQLSHKISHINYPIIAAQLC